MLLQVDCVTPKGKIVSIPILPNSRGGTDVSFMPGGVSIRVTEYAHHRFGLAYVKDQFAAYPNPDADSSFEMVERPIFNGTRRRAVVWNFHESVPVYIICTIPRTKGLRRRFVWARIWTTEASLTSDPR